MQKYRKTHQQPALFAPRLAAAIQRNAATATTPMTQAGPPVPPGFAHEILSRVAQFLWVVRKECPKYQEMLAELHPQAKSIREFLRAQNPLPVGSYKLLRKLAKRLEFTHLIVGPKVPASLIGDIVAPLAERSIPFSSIRADDDRYREIFKALNANASTIADFVGSAKRMHIGSHYMLRHLVQLVFTPAADRPAAPPHLVREILQPLVDLGYDLADFNDHDRRYLKALRFQAEHATSFADFVIEGAAPINAHNELRRTVNTILQRHRAMKNSAEKYRAHLQDTPHQRVKARGEQPIPAGVELVHVRKPGQLHHDPAGTGLTIMSEQEPSALDWQREREAWGIG